MVTLDCCEKEMTDMPALLCDCCNAPLPRPDQNGIAECTFCGTIHTQARIREKVQEIRGVVEVTRGNAERDRLLN